MRTGEVKSNKRGLICTVPWNKEDSKRADTHAVEKIKVYSNGSAHDRKVGAAVILKREGKPDHVLKLHLGTTGQHTVQYTRLN